ncbi:hypothetical protein OAS39_04150 [Pirellulales bacterium]|nr:hypothetical protein [Pirellulales bacterium]
MSSSIVENSQADIMGRALDCQAESFSPDVAQFILSLRLATEDERRMNELAEHSRRGELTADDELELEEFRRCGRLLEMLKLKAQKALPR